VSDDDKQAKVNYDDVSVYPLDEEKIERLLQLQSECSVLWSTSDGWPVGVMHRFVYQDGKFWVTCASQRKRVPALKKRNKSAVIISSEGTPFGRDQTLTVKCLATVHEDNQNVKDWFYRALAMKLNNGDQQAAAVFEQFLDTPTRVIIELEPTKWITYDGKKVAAHVAGEWFPGNPWPEELPAAPAWMG
jgi:general stress protein 26